MHELMTLIVVWLAINFGLPETYEHPQVHVLPVQEMTSARYQAFLAAGKPGAGQPPNSSNVVAFYDNTHRVIFKPEGWDARSPADQSVLVHEMVHHLQNMAGLTYPCAQAREELAFAAQEQWLRLFGLSLESEFGLNSMTILVRTKCMF